MGEKRIAIYIRLSLADEGIGRAKDESDSIVNQRSLIHRFLDNHAELSGYPRTEFVDDGYSGTNMERPAFQRMIAGIREGGFLACITKDFSRFSRDYIEMGDYLECLFPFLNVRYISINDGYDSQNYKGTTGGLDVVMRTIVYDAYSKDLSVKESAGKKQGRKKGRRSTGLPAYGYMPDPDRKGMDIIDPEAAAVVRRIFDLAVHGMPMAHIAEALNKDGIPTPAVYFREKHPETNKYGYVSPKAFWTTSTVRGILCRYTYTGASVGNVREQVRPCCRATVLAKREDWIVVPNMHEAIITEEEFEKAQGRMNRPGTGGAGKEQFPLKSLVVCGNCGRRLIRKKEKNIMFCRYGSYGGDPLCAVHISPDMDTLEHNVYEAIADYIMMADGRRRQQREARDRHLIAIRNEVKDLAVAQKRIDALKKEKFRCYERYCAGELDKDGYLAKKKEMDSELEMLGNMLSSGETHIKEIENEIAGIRSESEAVCEVYRKEKELTYDMAHAFVEKVIIYPDERIEIKWKFKDCLGQQ